MVVSRVSKTPSSSFTAKNIFPAIGIIFLFITSTLYDGYAKSSPDSVAIPDNWIDSSTGHTILRLSRREGENTSFYFHNNPFIRSADGTSDWMLYYGSTGQ